MHTNITVNSRVASVRNCHHLSRFISRSFIQNREHEISVLMCSWVRLIWHSIVKSVAFTILKKDGCITHKIMLVIWLCREFLGFVLLVLPSSYHTRVIILWHILSSRRKTGAMMRSRQWFTSKEWHINYDRSNSGRCQFKITHGVLSAMTIQFLGVTYRLYDLSLKIRSWDTFTLLESGHKKKRRCKVRACL